jgi:parallel beta-helix repeat protein
MADNPVSLNSIPRWLGIAMIVILALLPAGALAVTYVDSPMVIEQPGNYVLIRDIANYDGIRWQNGTDYYLPCIVILASDVIFDGNGHTINGQFNESRTQNDQIGIYVDSGLERVSVINTTVNGFNYGIYYYGVNSFAVAEAGGRIDNNHVTDTDVGIVLDTAQGVTVSNNNATDNRHNGIELYSAGSVIGNTVTGNNANNNVDNGIYLASGSNNNYVTYNTANNNINASSADTDDIALRGNGITVDQSSDNHITNNIVSGNHLHGIAVLPDNSGNWVDNNIASDNGHGTVGDGIYIDTGSESTNVNGNHAFDNVDNGIHLNFIDGSDLINNNVANGNGVAGILLEGSSHNFIGSNIAFDNKYGIELSNKMNDDEQMISSDDNDLSNNTVYENFESGIYLNGPDNFEPMINNRVFGNNVHDNVNWGIHIQHSNLNKFYDNLILGNGVLGVKLNASSYNVLYNNVFNNTMNAGFGQQSASPNTWSVLKEPGPNIVNGPWKGGNFWAKPDGNGFSQITPEGNVPGFCVNEFQIGPDNIDDFPLFNQLKASFIATPMNGSKPLTVQFTDTSSGSPTAWFWDFGDGNSSTLQNPTHTYVLEGTYYVTLTVFNNGGSSSTKPECNCTPGIPIIVGIQPPVADFTTCAPCGPRYGTFPLTVTFKDLSTGSEPRTYLWNFGDGQTSTDRNPVHNYMLSNNYTVSLTVTNPAGSDTATKVDYISSTNTPPPVVDFSASPRSGTNPLIVVFTDQTVGSLPLQYVWDFGDGSVAPERFDKNPVHTYASTGTYDVTLTATNPGGEGVKTYPHFIGVNLPPAPTAEFTAVPWSGTAPLTVNFVDQSTESPTQWLWDFGDGSTGPERFQKNPVHVYTVPNTYTISLMVTGAGGASAPRSHTVLINPPSSLVANFNAAPVTGIMPLTVQFIDTSTGNPTSWQWNFGDGSTSSLQSPSHVYTEPGKYTVTLTISNAQGSNTMMMGDLIYVRNTPPTADFSGTPLAGAAPLSVQFSDESTGNAITQWHWDFGDGTTSVGANNNPIHVYQTQGLYTVILVASNDGGSSTESKPAYVNVSNFAPTADFTAVPSSGSVPLNVQFTDQSSGSGLNYLWQFGDGQTSTIQNPTHTYTTSGIFNVNLTVTSGGGTSSKIKTISTNSPDANNIHLSTGWNFVSVPKVLAPGSNTGAIFNDVDTGGHSIWQYDAFNQTWTRIVPSSLVQPLFGYWIFSTSPTVVPLMFTTDPTQVPPTKQLAAGWNSIGFTGVDPATARDTLISVNSSWTQAMGFDAGAQAYDTQIVHGGSGQFSDTRLLFPTDGYWLFMTSPGTLSAIGG